MSAPALPPLTDRLRRLEVAARGTADRRHAGRLLAVTGTIVRAEPPGAEVGELCELRDPRTGATRMAEVVGLDGAEVLLAPYGSSAGLSLRTEVAGLGIAPSIEVGDHLLGAVIGANGRPMLGRGLDPVPGRAERRPVDADPPNPMARAPVDAILTFGVRVLDGLMPCGVGQRIGVFADTIVAGLLVMIFTATLDYKIARIVFARDNKMTLTEMKKENKENEGTPEVKRERRRIMQEGATTKVVRGGDKATIVIVSGEGAVGLYYEDGIVPIVVAKLYGKEAADLVQSARGKGVPVAVDDAAVMVLMRDGRVGTPISEANFAPVVRAFQSAGYSG